MVRATVTDWRLGVFASIAAIAVFAIAQSATFPLLAILMERDGHSNQMIGFNTAVHGFAIFLGGFLMPGLARRIGLPGVVLGGLVVSIAMMLIYPLIAPGVGWLLPRLIHGIGSVGLFYASELWIVSRTPEGLRGRMVAVYAIALSLGFAAGPVLLAQIGTVDATPFLVVAGLTALAIIPALWARKSAPDFISDERGGGLIAFWQMVRDNPTVFGAVALFGVVEFGGMALLVVWGLRLGFDEHTSLMFEVALLAGHVLMQFPLGWAADRYNRRWLMIGAAFSCLVAAVLLPLLVFTPLIWVVLVIWGGLAGALYTVALVELGARFTGQMLSLANATVVAAYGLGAVIAPVTLGLAMDGLGAHGLMVGVGAYALSYLALAIWRLRQLQRRTPGNSESA